jgi:hypothetical protein
METHIRTARPHNPAAASGERRDHEDVLKGTGMRRVTGSKTRRAGPVATLPELDARKGYIPMNPLLFRPRLVREATKLQVAYHPATQ